MDHSKSLFRDMIQTALDKDLNKTELQVFLVVLMQTLGFGKASDPLSYGRIAKTMHKRKDHVKQSARNLVKSGLFDTQRHHYFDFTYTIGAKFLSKHRGDFFTPTLPKTGEGYRKMEDFTENWEHTDNYLYSSLSKQQPTHSASAECTKNNQTVPKHNDVCGGGHDDSHQEPCRTNVPPDFDWNNIPLPKLPDSIRQENHAMIYGLFKQGNLQQAENALAVFNDMQSKRLVHSPTNLLKSLTERAHSDKLTLPDDPDKVKQYDPRNIPLVESHKPFNPDPLAHLTPEERILHKRKEDIIYLTDVSRRENLSMVEMAKRMCMEHIIPHLDPATCHDKPVLNDPINQAQKPADDFPEHSISGMLKHMLQAHGGGAK